MSYKSMPTPNARTILHAIEDHSKNLPRKTCLIRGELEVSYAALNDHIMAIAYWLNDQGVRPRDVVGIRYSDSVSIIVSVLGVMRVGAVPLLLMPTFTNDQEAGFLKKANASWLLSNSQKVESPRTKALTLPDPLQLTLSEFTIDQVGSPNELAIIVTSSGSTGTPRLIPVSHKALTERELIARRLWSLDRSDRVMVLSPAHFFAPTQRICIALAAGATGILWDNAIPSPSNIKKLMPTILHLSVFHAERILSLCESSDRLSLNSIRVISIGASRVSDDLRQRMKLLLGAKVHVHYGSNETFTIAYAFPDEVARTEGTVGRPPHGVIVEIVDKGGKIVPNGIVGEIRVNSPAQIFGYYNDDGNDRFIDEWFYPGDLGKYTEDGQIIHCGRSDQMMLMNGINIYPAEIERILVSHPGIDNAVALALNHPVAQDLPVAAVVSKDGFELNNNEILNFCKLHLGVKAPKIVFKIDRVPYDEQGKVKRKQLRNLLIEVIQNKNATKKNK